jgi:probable HAF family extracellular repeat protein
MPDEETAMRPPSALLGLPGTLVIGAVALMHLTACGGSDGVGPGSLASVNLPDTTTLGIDGVIILRARDGSGNDIPAQSLQWTSADPTIAQVDESGNVVGVAAGEVDISASSPQSVDACRVTVLPIVSLNDAYPNDINVAGTVVGEIGTHAFVWTRSTGIRELTGIRNTAWGIADNGTVVGTNGGGSTCSGAPAVWTFDASGVPMITELPWTGGPGGAAQAIAPSGNLIVGQVFTRPAANICNYSPALWTRTLDASWSLELLPIPEGAFGIAISLNDHEQVVGVVEVLTPSGPGRYTSSAVIWKRGPGSSWLMEALTTGAGGTVQARAINAAGDVVGDNADRAVRWVRSGGEWTMTDLGTLGGTDFSFAADINDLGEIVGGTFDQQGRQRAFVWTVGEGMRDLGSLTQSAAAFRINNSGTVIGVSGFASKPRSIGTLWPGR